MSNKNFIPKNVKSKMLKGDFPKKDKGIGQYAGKAGKVGKMKAQTKEEAVEEQMKKTLKDYLNRIDLYLFPNKKI